MADRRQRWFIDGYEITEGVVRDVETFEGQFTSPTILTTDLNIPGRDGEVPGPGRLSPGGFTLQVWVAGSTRAEIERNWEFLLQIAMKRHKLTRWTRHRPDGTVRECHGRVVGRISPTPIGQYGMRAQIEVTIPSGTWQDPADTDSGLLPLHTNGPVIPAVWDDPNEGGRLEQGQLPPHDPAGGALTAYHSDGSATYTNGWIFDAETHLFRRTGTITTGPLNRYVQIPNFQGSTAPMTRLWIQVIGGASDVRVICPETGTWFRYTGSLNDGQVLTVDGRDDAASAPGDIGQFTYRGPYMMEMLPHDLTAPAHPPLLHVTATQATAAARLRVVGRRLYQTM